MCTEDPRYISNTGIRYLKATRRIPGYVRHLMNLEEIDRLHESHIELLYREFRAYFRSSRPFRRDIGKVKAWNNPFRYCPDRKLLDYLSKLDLQSTDNDKQLIHHALVILLFRARERDRNRERASSRPTAVATSA